MKGEGAFFWFDSQSISASGEHLYGAVAYRAVLPHFAPKERSGSFVFFDGDFLPPAPMQPPARNPAEKAIANAVVALGGLAYAVAVFAEQPSDFFAIDAALRRAEAPGYLGMLASPGVDLDEFLRLRESMSLVPSLRIDDGRLRRVDFSFLRDDALAAMGFAIDAAAPPPKIARTPCVLVLDASAHMGTAEGGRVSRLEMLNAGLRSFADDLAKSPGGVHLAIVCVGGVTGDADLMMDWTDGARFQAFRLRAAGGTALGKGLKIALAAAEAKREQWGTTPWIVVIAGGEPTDPVGQWTSVTAESRTAEREARCRIVPVAVDGANVELLQGICAAPVLPLRDRNFTDFFRWLASALRAPEAPLPATDAWS